MLQADLVNAYNSVDRGFVLEEVATHFPECFAWVKSCYGNHSWLKFGESVIMSATGLHQGDPVLPGAEGDSGRDRNRAP